MIGPREHYGPCGCCDDLTGSQRGGPRRERPRANVAAAVVATWWHRRVQEGASVLNGAVMTKRR